MTTPPSPTVFVVDDYAPVRSSISRLLRAAGFAVAAFGSPQEFLAQYDPRIPGCLVLDQLNRITGVLDRDARFRPKSPAGGREVARAVHRNSHGLTIG